MSTSRFQRNVATQAARRDVLKWLGAAVPGLLFGCGSGPSEADVAAAIAADEKARRTWGPGKGKGGGGSGGGTTTTTPFQVGTQTFAVTEFQLALDALPDGGTLLIQAGSYAVTGTLRARGATIRAVGGKATLDGKSDTSFPAQGKGLIVLAADGATFEDLVFRNVRVPDRNGVGVRVEAQGTVTFTRCEFHDSDEGILTGNNAPGLHVVMTDCVGRNLGYGDGQSHGVYCGTIGSLTINGGSWTDINEGHLIKSRAALTRLTGVQLTEGRASRAVDVPHGGVVEISGCTIAQSQDTGNSNIIGYGLEIGSPYWPTNRFTFAADNVVTDTRSPPGPVFQFASWFSDPSARAIGHYTYNGSNANPPGATV